MPKKPATQLKIGDPSPWGPIEEIENLRPGWQSVETADHGGFYLSPERNERIPAVFRKPDGWYEEEIEAVTPSIVFLDEQDDEDAMMSILFAQESCKDLYTHFAAKIDERLACIPDEVQVAARKHAAIEREEVKPGDMSPWGVIQDVLPMDLGIQVVLVGGGAGIKLASQANEAVLEDFRKEGGWYSHDREWIIPVCFHMWSFPVERVVIAHHLMRDYCPPLYETLMESLIQIMGHSDDCANPDCPNKEHKDVLAGAGTVEQKAALN